MDKQKECAREGSSNAQNAVEGKEYKDPSKELYHINSDLSMLFTGFQDKKCAWRGKNFIPTRPEYAWKNCCSYSCLNRYTEANVEQSRATPVVMMSSTRGEDIRKFDSAEEAAEYIGVKSAKYVRDACNGKTRSCGGFQWRWAKSRDEEVETIVKEYAREEGKTTRVDVRLNNEDLDYIEKLASQLCIPRSKVVKMLVEKSIRAMKKRSIKYESIKKGY